MNPAKKLLLALLLSAQCTIIQAHPVHMSVTNITIENNEIQINFKLFKDDFLIAISNIAEYPVKIVSDSIHNDEIKFITRFLNNNFKFYYLDKQIIINKLSYTFNEESVVITTSFKINKPIKSIEIENTLMLNMFPDQTNLIIIDNNGKERGIMFDNKNTKAKFNL